MPARQPYDRSPALRIACDVSWCAGKLHLAHAKKLKLTREQAAEIHRRLREAMEWVEDEMDSDLIRERTNGDWKEGAVPREELRREIGV